MDTQRQIAAWLILGLAVGSGSPMQATADLLHKNDDGTVIVTGTVVENWRGCERDATCGLRLRVGKQKIGVVYNPGEAECKNEKASKMGEAIKPGQRVKVYGTHQNNQISICASDAFYIVPLDEKTKPATSKE